MVHRPGCEPMIFLLGNWWSVCFCWSPETDWITTRLFDMQKAHAAISKASGDGSHHLLTGCCMYALYHEGLSFLALGPQRSYAEAKNRQLCNGLGPSFLLRHIPYADYAPLVVDCLF